APVMLAAAICGRLGCPARHDRRAVCSDLSYAARAGRPPVRDPALLRPRLGVRRLRPPAARLRICETGLLSLGASPAAIADAAIAVAIKHEIVLAVVGGLFVLETMSVIIQVMSFKWTGKRVFKMAPLHHHYEQKGWKESTVVIRFWIISVILALVGLSTLKLR